MAIFSGIAAAIGGLLGGTFLSGAVGSFLIRAAVGIGLNLLASAWAGQPEKPSFSIQGQLQAGGDVSRSFIVGRTATAGSLVYANTWGKAGDTPNAYFTQVIALADLPTQELVRPWVNGEKCSLLTDDPHEDFGLPVAEYRDDGKDYLWIKFYDGTQTAADDFLVGQVSTEERPYESTRVGVGVSYVICTARINDELFTGFPAYKFEVLGTRLYDVTKDSTAGGSGPHRAADPTTWGGDGDELPGVQIHNLLLGLRFGSEWFYGLQGVSPVRMPAANWRGQINKCRAAVDKPGGGTERQYLSGIEIQVNAPVADAVEAFLSACQGRLIDSGGVYTLRVGSPDDAVFAFSDGDILSTEAQSFSPFFGLADTVNGISASYPEPAEGWNAKAAPTLLRPDLEARDGNRRLLANVQLGAVRRASQVQRLIKSALEEARRARRHTLVLGPAAWVLEPGDVVAWTSTRNGYDAKLMRVDGVVDKPNLDVILDLTEVDPSDYDWNPSTDYVAPTFGFLGPVRPTPQVIVDWFASPATINDAGGNARRPAIKLGWNGAVDDVEAVLFQVRLAETQEVVYRGRTDDVAAGVILLSQNLLPASAYEARGRYAPNGKRKTLWSNWLAVTTPDTRLTDGDVYLPGLLEDIEERFQDFDDFIGAEVDDLENQIEAETDARVTQIVQEQEARIADAHHLAGTYRALINEVGAVRDLLTNATFDSYQHVEQVRTLLATRVNDVYAEFDQRIIIATGDSSGLVQRLTRLETGNADLTALVGQVDTASVNGLNALAQQISLLSAGTNNQFDPAQLWNFVSTIEGWTGNGTPTFDASGALRPADQAATPYVISPTALAVQATAYRQVRARIRKVGTPTWAGYAWWKTTSDTTWDTARRSTISEPSYDTNGYGLLTWQMDWAGTIDSIRVELSAAQTSTNYFLIDWIGVGSPSPGASRAELLAERTARIAADSAQTTNITALQAAIGSPTTGLGALSTAVTAMDARVDLLEDGIAAHGVILDSLETEITGKASIESVQLLQNDIDALDAGGISSIGGAVTSIRNQLLPMASQLMEQGFQNFLANMENKRITADVAQSLTTRIEQTNDNLLVVSTALTKTQAEIPDLAKATAVQALDSRLTANEVLTAAAGTALTQVKAELGWDEGAASGSRATALNILEADVAASYGLASAKNKVYRQNTAPAGTTAVPLVAGDLWVDTANDNLTKRWSGSAWIDVTDARVTASAASITSIKSELGWDDAQPSGGKATGLSVIRTNVDTVVALADAKNRIFRQSAAPTGTTAIPLRAGDVWFDTANDNRPKRWSGSAWVDVSDARVQATAELVQSISATVDDNSANARFRMATVTGPTGYARIAARVKYSASGVERSAGWYVDVPSNTDLDSVFLVEADQFAIRNGSAKDKPFIVQGGEVIMNVANIGTVNAGVMQSLNGKMRIDLNAGTIRISS
ncbi:phage tail protein [Shinella sp. M31]|uniref:phage tail protein n=1 Tax=Shinella sp. M31 TaxID=3368615 RepID=UPI003BA0FC2C